MAELIGGALLGTAVGALYGSLKALIGKNLPYGSILENVISRLDGFKPFIQQMTEVYSEEELQGLLEVIKDGKVLVGSYLVHGRKPKKEDTKKFGEWDDRLKQQLEMLNMQSRIDGRKTVINIEEMVPLVRETKTSAQNTELAVQQLQLDGRKTVDNTEEIVTLLRETNTMVHQLHNRSSDTEKQNLSAENEDYCAVPELPPLTVGLDGPLKKLKRMMFKDGKSMIVVNAIGGAGKTTLAINFCRDPEVKDIFKKNIFFVTVSENFNLELIVQQLYQRKGLKEPDFTSQENAVTSLQRFLREEKHNPFLLVLDDVWPESEKYLGKFQLTEMKDNKILVTSRSQLLRFVSQDSQYKLEALNDHYAMELFNHSINSSPDDPELSKTIVDSCKGSPLLLTVVGGSLSGQHIDVWRTMSSKGCHEDEVYDCLQRSLDVLNKNMKEYFLDLGAFPDHKRISVGALVDMWAELYDLTPDRDGLNYDEEDTLCNDKLIKLKNRNLVNLVDTRKDDINEDGYRKGDYVTLHDLLKEQAIQNSGRGREEQRTRLIVNIRGVNIPRWWRRQKFQARLLSISTDSEFSNKLPNMTLKKAEVLKLNFLTKKYLLPEFVKNMAELRVLFVKYDGSSYQSYHSYRTHHSYAELDNFKQLGSLPNLKRITLESLSMSSITENTFKLGNLIKMSLILCYLSPSPAFSNGRVKISDAFPKLEELIVDRCYNCNEFLTECCDLVQLTKLSIINCRGLQFLPERIGSLVNLEVLRLRSCKDLLVLPDSVVNLKLLKFLDISECSRIWRLPISMDEMSSLIKLDLRYCHDTSELHRSVSCLKQLKEVICTCNQWTKMLWEAVKPSLGRIIILEKVDYCAVPKPPPLTVGQDVPLGELKRMMFEEGKSMIVVNAMGGSGKTTLAINFCRDPQVEETFKDNIFFVTVSKKFTLELILQQLHQHKGLPVPVLTSPETAVTWLHMFLKKEEHNPLLLVLDDVWPESESFLGKFLSKEMNYKILVTSRSLLLRFASQDSQYKLESLNVVDAMKLFNHSTNGSPDPELSDKIVQSWKGSPLALTVVGRSLSGQPIDIWRKRIIESSKGPPTTNPEDELYNSLQRSLEDLDKNIKEYFLDLGAFPDHKRISVGALIDMWAELYDLSPDKDGVIHDEEDALCNALYMLCVNHVDTRKDKIDEDGYRKEDYVTLHDLLKALAIQNSALVPEEQRTRLIVDIRGDDIPRWWRRQKFQARLLSISTDSEFSNKLPNMTLEKAEVLMLNFRTKKYLLPEFVKNMAELRVLFVKYDGSSYQSYAELDNFEQLGSLPNLKRITLESLSMHSIMENPFRLKSLVKMSLILCDLTPSFSNGCVMISEAFPKLQELIIDGCSYCEEFLTKCCDLVHLTKLSIINCGAIFLA